MCTEEPAPMNFAGNQAISRHIPCESLASVDIPNLAFHIPKSLSDNQVLYK